MDQIIGILSSDSLLVPIIIGSNGAVVNESAKTYVSHQNMKQVYLVHLQVGKMAVTVYTSKEFAEDVNVEDPEAEANPGDTNSDELNETGDEFSIP